ncbi:MAG: immune inhibitor A domain-containing protein, partial [Planctomycetota bacterium]|nr:immune inhibitor A domain-containing protein [Planctomycetota bacterium]
MNLVGGASRWLVVGMLSTGFAASAWGQGKGVPVEADGYPICLGSPGHDCGLHQDSRGTTHPALVEQDGWANRTSSRTWTIGDLVPQPISGTYTLPVVIFGYSNVSQPDGVLEHLQTLLGAESPLNSMRSYYQTMSGGRFDVIPEFFVIPNLPEEDTFYETTEANPQGEYRLLQHVVAALDHQVDFTRYDNDGPDGIPNSGDDDGRVDTMILVFPECANKKEGNIWPHAGHAIWLNEGAGVPTADPSENPNPDNGGDVVVLGKYTLQTTVNCEGQIVNRLRTFKHELGHCLGIRDLYDTEVHNDEDDDPWPGLGRYCLMASGSGHMSAWCKARLGWVDVISLTGLNEELVEFPRSFASETVWKIDINQIGSEYFLIEHRSQDDTFDNIFGFGLLIYHVDESRRTNNRPDCSGQDPFNHPKVTLEQADGLCEIENGSAATAHSDFWRSDMADRFAADTFPHSLGYSGFNLGIEIREISDPWQETMTAVVTAPEPPLLAIPGPLEIVWLFDLSGSYADDLVHMRAQIPGAIQDSVNFYPVSRDAVARV